MRLSGKTIAVVGGSAQTGSITPEAAALLGAAAEPWGAPQRSVWRSTAPKCW